MILSPLISQSISGTVNRVPNFCSNSPTGGVGNAVITLSAADGTGISVVTNSQGNYSVPYYVGANRLCASKVISDASGISVDDIDEIRNYVLFNICFPNVWQYYAADVNQNGLVSSQDIGLIQDRILGIPFPEAWVFTIKEHWDVIKNTPIVPIHCYDKRDFPLQPCKFFSALNLPLGSHDYVGIKLGDVDGTEIDCNNFQSGTQTRSIKERIEINCSLIHNLKGYYQFKMEFPNDANIAIVQFKFKHEIKNLICKSSSGDVDCWKYTYDSKTSKVKAIYVKLYSDKIKPLSFEFNAKSNLNLDQEIIDFNSHYANELFFEDEVIKDIAPIFQKNEKHIDIQLSNDYLYLHSSDLIKSVTLMDLYGRIVLMSTNCNSHNLELKIADLKPGIYYYYAEGSVISSGKFYKL